MGNQIGAQNSRTGPMGMTRETTALRKENQELMRAQSSYQMGDYYGARMYEDKAMAFGLAAEKQHDKRFRSGKTVMPWAHPVVNTVAPGTGMYNTSFYNTAVPAAPMAYNSGMYNSYANYGNYSTLNTGFVDPAYTAINGGFGGGMGMSGFQGFGASTLPLTSSAAYPLSSTISAPIGATGTYW